MTALCFADQSILHLVAGEIAGKGGDLTQLEVSHTSVLFVHLYIYDNMFLHIQTRYPDTDHISVPGVDAV